MSRGGSVAARAGRPARAAPRPAALDVPVALDDEAVELAADAVEVVGGEDGRGTGRQAVSPLAAEQPVERGARRLPGDVPERHVDGADAEGDEAAVADPVGRMAETAPDAHDVTRVASHRQGARRRSTTKAPPGKLPGRP
jgi:hypothetical protein